MTTIQLTPSTEVYLRGVDPEKCLQKYKRGEYFNIVSFDNKKKTTIVRDVPVSHTVFDVKKIDKSITIANYLPKGDSGKIEPVKYTMGDGSMNCSWCLKPIDGVYPIGIPMSKMVRTGKPPKFYCLHMHGSFDCALARLNDILSKKTHNPWFSKSKVYLEYIFNVHYPGKTLAAAGDRDLLKIFNGTMSYEEFHTFSRTRKVTSKKYVIDPVAIVIESIPKGNSV
jgi:hypothetical protein